MVTLKLDYDDIRALLEIDPGGFEKYVSPILNIANRFSQGTRPRVVGKVTDLIKEFVGVSYEDWEAWYLENYGEKLEVAVGRISDMLKKIKGAVDGISEADIERYVKDLVLAKTYIGLKFQEAIIKAVAAEEGKEWRMASPEDESRNIDGYIDGKPVSIKPVTYRTVAGLGSTEDIEGGGVSIIYYEKKGKGIIIEY